MRRIIIIILIGSLLSFPVFAQEYTAPTVPQSGETYMPKETETFSEGLWFIIKSAISNFQPSFAEAMNVCLSLVGICLFITLVKILSEKAATIAELTGTVTIAVILFSATNTLIHLGGDTINELSEYGKLLLPVMTASMAAQGSITTSAALYAGSVFFITILTQAISKLLLPAVYVHLCICIAARATQDTLLEKVQKFIKWLCTWGIKTVLYTFIGYMGITGVVSGTADAAAVRAAKLTISGMVPVVGGIIADASETVLVSAGVMKSAAGVYGLLAIMSVWIGPFIQIGAQYLMLKLTGGMCSVFDCKQSSGFIEDISGSMGLILGMVSSVCLLLLVSTVCFMRGIT